MTDVILAIVLLFPLACAYFLKSKGSLAFFAVCSGFVLVDLASADIGNLLHRGNITNLSMDTRNLILIFVPLLLTLLLARGHSIGKAQKILSLVAAFCAGSLAVLVAAPFFGSLLPSGFANSQIWSNLHKVQAWLISAGALASFISIWLGSKSFKRHR